MASAIHYMNKAYLLTGGNMGDRQRLLDGARAAIGGRCGTVAAASSIYETEAWGLEDQGAFLNQALEVHTSLPPAGLLQCVLQIEEKLGRIRLEKYGPRPIDIDILLYNGEVIDLPQLNVPHPRMHERRFVLQCLSEIAPDVQHPVFRKSIRQLLEECKDPLKVKRVG